ncbi:MAG TPA: hypothetical protein VK589_19745 [Chryseolinea sp.]|nr:hypothetical protein [Chryseolinea sp.]
MVLLSLGNVVSAQIRPYAPEIFPEKISGAVCGFGNNGKTIYFVREDTTEKKLFLFEADWDGMKWNNVRRLSFSGKYNDYGGRLTTDGNTFYFASDRPGASDNARDVWNIWKVRRSSLGWKDPEPLRAISNKGDECCPVPLTNEVILFSATRGKEEWQILQSDKHSAQGDLNSTSAWQWPSYYDATSKILLFNSMKRSDSKGMDDIYIAHFSDGIWSNVRNIGEVINTAEYEDGAILSPDRKLLIFCRHETGSTPSKVLCVEVNKIPMMAEQR